MQVLDDLDAGKTKAVIYWRVRRKLVQAGDVKAVVRVD
jgi:hypothetical protein